MAANRDQLFGMMALRAGLIDRTDLDAATRACSDDQSRIFTRELADRAGLDRDVCQAVETMIDHQMTRHGGSLDQTISALSTSAGNAETLDVQGEAGLDGTVSLDGSPTTSGVEGGASHLPFTAGIGRPGSVEPRFRILRPHARGGLGAVSVALDIEVNREVALKQILENHAENPVSRARFLLEAEITGGLEHPGIVPVYGMGLDAEGRPYYAMRFIRGETMKEAIDHFHAPGAGVADPGRRTLELRQLLRRFVDVCNAIEYAHARGVLHRDIKPANVIVGSHGETLVVDWGLAKRIGGRDFDGEAGEFAPLRSSASGSAETLPGSAMGTPAYMSPEQAAGDLDRLGPGSDVYSLGATLYHLLTGQMPIEGSLLREMLDAVKQGRIVPPRKHDPSIDPALEAVCLKAMALRPEDRYASARTLAEDIERWMAEEPVTAWREPFSRRARRWARRNRTAVAIASVAMIAGLVAVSAVAFVQTQARSEVEQALRNETRANAALASANAELGRSRAAVQARYDLAVQAIRTFHTGVSRDFLLREPRFQVLRDRLLQSAADFYGKLGALLGKETDRASRRALTSANFELADLTAKVGRNEDALASHRAVLSARRTLAAETLGDVSTRVDVGRSLTEIAGLLEATGKTDEALAAYREAENVLAGLAESSTEARAAMAACRSRMGFLLVTIGKESEALAIYRKAEADQQAIAASKNAPPEALTDLGDTINRIGRLFQNTGRPKEADLEYRHALEIRRRLFEAHPDDSGAGNAVAASHNNIGNVLWKSGRLREAEVEYREAMKLWGNLAESNPAVAEFRKQLQTSQCNLANMIRGTGRRKEAEALFREAMAILRDLVAAHPNVPDHRRRLALVHHDLGMDLREMGRIAEAEVEQRAALAVSRDLIATNPAVPQYRSDLAMTQNELGILLAESGRSREAETAFRAGLSAYRDLVQSDPTVTEYRDRLATGYVNLGEFLADSGQPDAADPEYRHAVEIFRELSEANPEITYYRFGRAYAHGQRGLLLARRGKISEAEAEDRAAASIYEALQAKSPKVPDYADGLAGALTILGEAIATTGRLDEARQAIDRAVSIREHLIAEDRNIPVRRGNLAASLRRRGLIRGRLGDQPGARADTLRALELYEGMPSQTSVEWFETACCHAAIDGPREADRAIETLRLAIGKGFHNLDALRAEPALDPIRVRPDFQALLMDLAMPDEPFATPR